MQGVHFEELGTEELNIPSLSARRTKLADGSLRVLILVCKKPEGLDPCLQEQVE